MSHERSQPFFLECDPKGNILWMSAGAKPRFDGARSVLEHLSGDALPSAQKMLGGEPISNEVHGWLAGTGGERVPVSFSRVFAGDGRVLLAAQTTEPLASATAGERSWLALQQDMVRHYFRLRDIHEKFEGARTRRARRGTTAVRLLEDERARMGRELHAGVGQALAGIRLQLELIRRYLPEPPEGVRASLDSIAALTENALHEVRSVSHRLYPPDWERLDIREALRQLWTSAGTSLRFEASLDLPPLHREPEHAQKVLIYRAAQEALSNIDRHAAATRVRMALETRGSSFVLRVEDNGRGFAAAPPGDRARSAGAGIGLRSVRDQAAALNGLFELESGASGTRFTLSLPIDDAQED